MIGGMRRRDQMQQQQAQQAQAQQAQSAQVDTYKRALSTCLGAKGYTGELAVRRLAMKRLQAAGERHVACLALVSPVSAGGQVRCSRPMLCGRTAVSECTPDGNVRA